jgi:hypothetical protein
MGLRCVVTHQPAPNHTCHRLCAERACVLQDVDVDMPMGGAEDYDDGGGGGGDYGYDMPSDDAPLEPTLALETVRRMTHPRAVKLRARADSLTALPTARA